MLDNIVYRSGEFEKLIYGTDSSTAFAEAATNLLTVLKTVSIQNGGTIRILDLGIGSGLFAAALVKKYLKNKLSYSFSDIKIVGVDSDDAMLENAKANLEKYHDNISISLQKCDIEDYITNAYDGEEKYDVVFCFAILHHLREPIKLIETLQQKYLSQKHLICVSEIHGDTAPWSNAYDKWGSDILLQNQLDSNNELRVKWLRFIRQYQQICDDFGFRYARYSSASNVSVYRDLLHQRGFEHCNTISQTFTVCTTTSKWIESIKVSSKNTPQFSTFPNKGHFKGIVKMYPQYDNADWMIEDYENKIDRLHKEIFENESEEFTTKHFWKIEVFKMSASPQVHIEKPCDYCGYSGWSVVQRSHELLKNYIHFPETLMMTNPQADGQELVDRKKNIRNLIIQDMRFLVDNQIIKNPLYISNLYWLVRERQYQRNLPMLFSTDESNLENSLKVFYSYYMITAWLDAEFHSSVSKEGQRKITSFLFKALPEKVIFKTHLRENNDQVDITTKFFQTGELEQIEFLIPPSEELRISFNDLWKTIIKKTEHLKPNKSNEPYYLLDHEEIIKVIKSLSEKDTRSFKIDYDKWYSSIKEPVEAFRDKFKNLIHNLGLIYSKNSAWTLLEKELNNKEYDSTFYSLFASVVLLEMDDCFFHIPSIDTWHLEENQAANNAKIYREEAVGGYVVLADKASIIKWDTLREVMLLKNRIYLIDEEKHYQAEANKKSATAAIAAIMTRNGSHNIGSHVLSAVTSNYTDKDEDDSLFTYIQQRMEFIAQIASSAPRRTYGALFYRQLWKNFMEQNNLLRFIAQGEGLSYGSNEGLHRITLNALYQKDTDNTIRIDSDFIHAFQVGIPGGVIGFHAFYTILENIIRNSAKHSWVKTKEKPDNLNINVKIFDITANDYYIVEVWDNVSIVTEYDHDKSSTSQAEVTILDKAQTKDTPKKEFEPLDTMINKIFCESFVDEFGSLKPGHWGLAEMKICAGFLAQRNIMDASKITVYEDEISSKNPKTLFNGKTGKGIIKAIRLENNLGYQFCIKKPKFALFIGFDIDVEELSPDYRNNGIYFENDLTGKQQFNYEYIFINDKDASTSIECSDNHSSRIEDLTTNIYCYLLSQLEEEDKRTKRSQMCDEILDIFEKLPLHTIIISDRISKIMGDILEKAKNDPIARRLLVLGRDSSHIIPLTEYDVNLKNKIRVEWMRHLAEYTDLNMPSKANDAGKELPRELKIFLNVNSEGSDSSSLRKYYEAVYNRYAIPIIKEIDGFPSDTVFPIFRSFAKKLNEEYVIDDTIERLLNEIKVNNDDVKSMLTNLFEAHRKVFLWSQKKTGNNQNASQACPQGTKSYEITADFKIIVSDNSDQSGYHLYLNKHRTIPKKTLTALWYREALSGSQLTFFSLINRDDTDSFKDCLLDVVESSLYKVMILDERIAEFIANCQANDRFTETKVYVVQNIFFDARSFNVPQSKYESKGNGAGEGISLHYEEDKAVEGKIEIVIIHQSLLDKFVDDDYKSMVKYLKENTTHIFITSGRGDPRLEKSKLSQDLKLQTKYISYGNVEHCIKKEFPDKTMLIKMLTSV